MTVGVGVEGPSDFQFWHKVLHKHFRGCRFDVRNMKNRDKLIREAPKLLETFRDCHYAAGFVLVDMDDAPCISSVVGLFDEAIQRATRLREKAARFFHVCVAIKEIESWYLADSDAINAVVPGCAWTAPADTCTVGKGRLRALVKAHLGENASFNEIAFAKVIAPKFNPTRARRCSASFRYFWNLMDSKTGC